MSAWTEQDVEALRQEFLLLIQEAGDDGISTMEARDILWERPKYQGKERLGSRLGGMVNGFTKNPNIFSAVVEIGGRKSPAIFIEQE